MAAIGTILCFFNLKLALLKNNSGWTGLQDISNAGLSTKSTKHEKKNVNTNLFIVFRICVIKGEIIDSVDLQSEFVQICFKRMTTTFLDLKTLILLLTKL